MNEPSTNPLLIALLFVGRCMIPVIVLIGISYILRKLGLVVIESPVDPNQDDEEDEITNYAEEPSK